MSLEHTKYNFPLRSSSSVGQYLNVPTAQCKLPMKSKPYGRVLTRNENIYIMEETEKAKKIEAMRKEEKKVNNKTKQIYQLMYVWFSFKCVPSRV